jgi:Activator of Hsp90 ATPase homolog 1-like protein
MTESVAVSRVVRTDPERAFRLFTEEVGAWYRIDEFTVVDHEKTVTLRFEPGVGGRFIDVYDPSTGEGDEIGRIQVWEPPHRLQFVDRRDCEVEVSFAAVPHGTRVTIEQRGLGQLPDDIAEHVRQWGWHIITPWFADYVTQRDKEI